MVADGAIGGEPHLLQVELLHSCLVWCDGGTLDADRVLLDGLGGVDGDLVLGGITVLQAEIVVLQVNVEVRVDELVLDILPDDAGHFISVELHDGVLDLDFTHGGHLLCLEC